MESMFSEIRIDFFDDFTGCWTVDAWRTEDDMEEGRVLAEIDGADGKVSWRDDTTEEERNDPAVIDAIRGFIDEEFRKPC